MFALGRLLLLVPVCDFERARCLKQQRDQATKSPCMPGQSAMHSSQHHPTCLHQGLNAFATAQALLQHSDSLDTQRAFKILAGGMTDPKEQVGWGWCSREQCCECSVLCAS